MGYDLVRLKGGLGYGSVENELIKILDSVNTDLVLDIGANKGQFAKKLIDFGYKKSILSFEPISSLHNILIEASRNFESWHIHDKCCIGNTESRAKINISNLIGNSSLLKIKGSKFNVTQSHYVDEEEVDQITLGSLNSNSIIQVASNIFIKMDVQGYEHVILSKLGETNYNIVGFFIELSLVELYDDQEDYLYICNQLKSFGYDLVYVTSESIRSNRMIQFNGVFLHNSLSYNT